MCFFDSEPCDFHRKTTRTARKRHKCGACSGVILAGTTYRVEAWRFEGAVASAKVCPACAQTLDDFTAHHGSCPTPDWLDEALRECFDGAWKHAEDARRWRSAYAGMLLRARAAQRVRP